MKKSLIILDTETTGLKPEQGHKLIEICAMEVINGVKTGEMFHSYLNPQRDVPYEAFKIHGISTEFLADKDTFAQVAVKFVDFIKEGTLVIHNARFDVGFLNYELKNLGHPTISLNEVIDTLAIARKKFPGSPANLDALCKRFKVNLSKRDKHGAVIDVELLYEVYKYLSEDHLLIKTEKKEGADSSVNVAISPDKPYKEPRFYSCSTQELEDHLEFLKSVKDPLWNN